MPIDHSVVICVHNALDDVKNCLASLDAERSFIKEIILVDDASDPETKAFLETFQFSRSKYVKLVRTKRRSGYTRAANLGLRNATGEVITLLNSDTVVPVRWAEKTVEAIRANPQIGVLGPLSNAASTQSVPDVIGTDGQTAINAMPEGLTVDEIDAFCERTSAKLDIPYVPLVHGFCMTITRRCLNAVGMFDEAAFPRGYGEESDFCMRVSDAGFLLGINIGSYVLHAKSKSYTSSERVELMVAGWDALVLKHGRRRMARSIQVMEAQPILQIMRDKFRERFSVPNVALQSRPSTAGEYAQPDVKAIAFYLPQFHPIPVNDELWGEGFTEWTNVVRAKPRFPGHAQPKLPTSLGFYDLRLVESLEGQARLMGQFGLHGACIYYYRLDGRRIMETPTKNLLAHRHVDMKFCYCWANESWTRAWDGFSSDVLLKQNYDEETFSGIVDDVAEAAKDDRYIRLSGRPLLMIYQVSEIPDAGAWLARLRTELTARTGQSFLIGTVFSMGFKQDMIDLVDLVVQFPPHRIPRVEPRKTIPASEVQPFEPDRKDYYEKYDDVVQMALVPETHWRKMALGVLPDWDNTPRRKTNAHTVIGSSPAKFEAWVKAAADLTRTRAAAGEIIAPVLFVNAWNEWAEGAILEPSDQHGNEYLQALLAGLSK